MSLGCLSADARTVGSIALGLSITALVVALLVVDDESSLRRGIEAYGQLRGYGVVAAGRGTMYW